MKEKQKIRKLRRQIKKHEHLYYVKNQPEISDQEFDQLLHELQQLEDVHPELKTQDSPTQRVGGEPIDAFTSVNHHIPMYSIDNTYNEKGLKDFDRRVQKANQSKAGYVLEPKIDGLAINLIYKDGVLYQAITRGDGKKGDDVTHNVKTIRDVPLQLNPLSDVSYEDSVIEVRGEIYMRFDAFEKANESRKVEGLKEFANPRNTAAGTLKLLNPKEASKRKLNMFAYDIGFFDGDGLQRLDSYLKVLSFLTDTGFVVNEHEVVDNIDNIMFHLRSWDAKRHDLEYPVDGMVVKVNRKKHQHNLGYTSKAPRYMVAYKFGANQTESKVNDVTVQVGRTGHLTPVAELEPTELCGTTIKRASLHNFEYVKEKDIRVGDAVLVEKAGEIIPQVVRPLIEKRDGNEKQIQPPKFCPVCGSDADKLGAFIRCVNMSCEAQLEGKIQHFSSREAMDIQGLGVSVIKKLIQAGMVETPVDLYHLSVDDLVCIEGVQRRGAVKLESAIQESKKMPMSKVLYGLGIPFIGKRVSKQLADEYGSIDGLREHLSDVGKLDNIGDTVCRNLCSFFNELASIALIEEFKEVGFDLREPKTKIDNNASIAGKKFVLTGTLQKGTRKEVSTKIESLGGKTSSSVSKNTDYLLVGDKPGSKLQKAKDLGVTVLSEEDFNELIN